MRDEKSKEPGWGQIGAGFTPGARSCLSLRDFVCQHCRHEGVPEPVEAPQIRSTLQYSPASLCSSVQRCPPAFSPRNNPLLISFPQDRIAFTPHLPASCRHHCFPPPLDVCPQDLHARKLKLPMAGSNYAPSLQIAVRSREEGRGEGGGVENLLRVLFLGAKSNRRWCHRCFTPQWMERPRNAHPGEVPIPPLLGRRKGCREPLTLRSSPGFISSFFPLSNSKWKAATYPGVTNPTLGSAWSPKGRAHSPSPSTLASTYIYTYTYIYICIYQTEKGGGGEIF